MNTEKNMEDKRGELTVNQIIVIIILIISFGVILLFWWQLNPGERTDKEICHSSVVFRGAIPVFKDSVKLKCKTQKVCITAGDCENKQLYNSVIKVKTKEEFEKELVNLMYDCWWMMGSGEIDYRDSTGKNDVFCAQCAIVSFDKSVKEKIGETTYWELFNYMRRNKVPGTDETFLHYLYNTDSVQQLHNEISAKFKVDTTTASLDVSGNKRYALVTGILKEGTWTTWGLVGAIIGVGIVAVAAPFIAIPVAGAIIIGGGAAGIGVGAHAIFNKVDTIGLIIKKGDNQFAAPMFVGYDKDSLSALKCSDFDTLS